MPVYSYSISLKLTEENKAALTSTGKPTIDLASPPDFGGPPNTWSPEEFFVASEATCLFTTMLYFARKQNIPVVGYESEASGVVEKTEKGLEFTSITVSATLWVPDEKSANIAKESLERRSKKYCLISNSITCPVNYSLSIAIADSPPER